MLWEAVWNAPNTPCTHPAIGKAFPLVPLLEFRRCLPAFSETERVLSDFAFLTHSKALHGIC